MPNREEALRRIFEATGVNARLTDEQKRELLAHLEDAVQAKVAAGAAEMDAVGQAFSEMGDLEKIAKQYPTPAAVAVTPEGARVLAGSLFDVWLSFSFFAFLNVLSWLVAPKYMEIFRQVRVPMPGLTLMFLSFSDSLRSAAGMTFMGLFGVGILVVGFRRIRLPRSLVVTLLLSSVTICVGFVLSLFLPLITLLEGVGRKH